MDEPKNPQQMAKKKKKKTLKVDILQDAEDIQGIKNSQSNSESWKEMGNKIP